MENPNEIKNYKSYYYTPALIIGILTGWIVWGTIGAIIICTIIFLLFAAFWLNVLEHHEEA